MSAANIELQVTNAITNATTVAGEEIKDNTSNNTITDIENDENQDVYKCVCDSILQSTYMQNNDDTSILCGVCGQMPELTAKYWHCDYHNDDEKTSHSETFNVCNECMKKYNVETFKCECKEKLSLSPMDSYCGYFVCDCCKNKIKIETKCIWQCKEHKELGYDKHFCYDCIKSKQPEKVSDDEITERKYILDEDENDIDLIRKTYKMIMKDAHSNKNLYPKAVKAAERIYDLDDHDPLDGLIKQADAILCDKKYVVNSEAIKNAIDVYKNAMDECKNNDQKCMIEERQITVKQFASVINSNMSADEICEKCEKKIEKCDDYTAMLEDAIEIYSKAIELFPKCYEFYKNRSNAYCLSDRYEEALQDINHCMEEKSDGNYDVQQLSIFEAMYEDHANIDLQQSWGGLFICGYMVVLMWFPTMQFITTIAMMMYAIIIGAPIIYYECKTKKKSSGIWQQYKDRMSRSRFGIYVSNSLCLASNWYVYYSVISYFVLGIIYFTIVFTTNYEENFNYYSPIPVCSFEHKTLIFTHDWCLYTIAHEQTVCIFSMSVIFIFLCIIRRLENENKFEIQKTMSENKMKNRFKNETDQYLILIHHILTDDKQIMIKRKCCVKCKCNGTTLYGCLAVVISLLISFGILIIFGFKNHEFELSSGISSPTTYHRRGRIMAKIMTVVLCTISCLGLCLLFTTLYRIIAKLTQLDHVMKIFGKPINAKCLQNIEGWWASRQHVLKWEIPIVYDYVEFGVGCLFLSTIILTVWMLIEIFFTDWDGDAVSQFFGELPDRHFAIIFAALTPISMIMSWIMFVALIKPYKNQSTHLKMLRNELLKLQMKQTLVKAASNVIYEDLVNGKVVDFNLSEKQVQIQNNWLMMNVLENMIDFCEKHPVYPTVMGTTLDGNSLKLFQGYLLAILVTFAGRMLTSPL